MRHKLYLDDYTQKGKNRITLPKALANYYGNTAQAYVNGRQVGSSVLKQSSLVFENSNKFIEVSTGSVSEIQKIKVIFYLESSFSTSTTNYMPIIDVERGGYTYLMLGNVTSSFGSSLTLSSTTSKHSSYINDTISSGWHSVELNWNTDRYIITLDGEEKTTYKYSTPYKITPSSGILIGTYQTAITSNNVKNKFTGKVSYVEIQSNTNVLYKYFFNKNLSCLEDFSGNNANGNYRQTDGTTASEWSVEKEDFYENIPQAFLVSGIPSHLTFTTPTPTREIEIGRGNLELTDTSGANEVGVLHWTPSSESGYYWVLSQGVEYILYGLPQIAVKHNEAENLANQTAVKTDESETAANQTTVKENITKHLAGKTKVVETLTDYLTALAQVYELSAEVLGVTDTQIKEAVEENNVTDTVVKQAETSNYPAFAKVVESFTDYLTNQTEVKEISAIVDGITNTIVKAVENNYALNQTAVKENAAAENLMSKVRVLQAQTDYLMNTTGVYVNFDLSAPAQNTIKNTESTYTVPTAKVVESYYQYLNTLATIDEAYGLNSWSGLETTDLDDMIPDYIHGFESLGHSYTSGQLEPVLKNITKDLTYQIGTFTGTTGKAKDGDYAMVYMPCEPGSYTVKIPQSVQLRSTDKLVVQDCLTLPVDAESSAVITSTEMNVKEQTVTITGNWIGFGINSSASTYFEVDFDEISINTYIDRGSQELPQLHGIDGVYSDTTSKRVEVETGVSGTGSVTYNGETFVAINESTGDPTWGDLAGAKSLSLSAGTYTVIYVLTDALTQDAKARMMTRFIYGDKNNYLVTHSKLDTFAGDGSTTAYTLTATADGTNYDVYVAGRPADATKTTTGFSFSTAPKRGAIIEARYNLGINTTWFMTLNIYEPSGTEVTISGIPELSISANKEFYEREDRLGDKEQKLKYKDYTITLNTDLLEDSQSFYDTWKDKKFRMIIENTAGSSYEKDIAAVCEITGHTKNYLGALESITIKATDYYEGVTA